MPPPPLLRSHIPLRVEAQPGDFSTLNARGIRRRFNSTRIPGNTPRRSPHRRPHAVFREADRDERLRNPGYTEHCTQH